MKKKRKQQKVAPDADPSGVLREPVAEYRAESEAMVRTQIYLSRSEYEFVQSEAARLGEPMAAIIRGYIDEKMDIPSRAWEHNPMLAESPDGEGGPEDGALNHDHYVYGAPKKWVRSGSGWVEAPPLPEDYHENPASRERYDAQLS